MATTTSRQTFEQSSELKRVFNYQFDLWAKRNRGGLQELAELCGVSAQYISHIGRYGRVPAKPILFLLAFNFEMSDPQILLRAAGAKESWPYRAEMALRAKSAADSGFLSVNLDMNGFASAIRDIVRAEIKPRSLDELLSGRPLRVGMNFGQSFLFGTTQKSSPSPSEGFFPEMMRLIALALHVPLELHEISHSKYIEALQAGEIDVYGPIYSTAPRIGQALYTNPFCRVQLAGLWRQKKITSLENLPIPKRVSDLRKKDFRIAVHAESMSHHFALAELGIPLERLILCETPEESFERILMSNVPRPAHLVLTDAPHALTTQAEHAKFMQVIFADGGSQAPPYEDTLAVRTDWPTVIEVFNTVLDFLARNSSLERLFQRCIEPEKTPGIVVAS